MAFDFENNEPQLANLVGGPVQPAGQHEVQNEIPQEAKPFTFGRFAQNATLNKGEYVSSGGNLYHQRDGKMFQVTGGPEGDRELKAEEAAILVAQKGQGGTQQETTLPTGGTAGESTGPRPAPTPRRRPEMYTGDVEPGSNPMNPPYDPESEAVRGKGGQYLSPELKDRLRGALKGTKFENMDLDSLKLNRGYTPWFLPSDKGGITLENYIYMDNPSFDPENDERDFKYLTEEAAHAGQQQYGDMTRAGYLWESLKNGYWENKYEKEAQRIAGTDKFSPNYRPPAVRVEEMNIDE